MDPYPPPDEASVTIRNEHRKYTTYCTLKCQLRDTKQRSNWWWRRLPQYRQLPDKSSRDGVFGIFRASLKFLFICSTMFRRTLCFREILFGEIWIRDTQPYIKTDSLQQPGKEPYPKPENPSPHPLPSFLNVIHILSFRIRVWCKDIQPSDFPQWGILPWLCTFFRCPHVAPQKTHSGGEGGLAVVRVNLAPMRLVHCCKLNIFKNI